MIVGGLFQRGELAYSSLKTQLRIIHAVMMREIITRYGRHNIGFAWLFAEPMMFTLGIVALWSVGEGRATHHLSIASLAMTGYSTVLIWRGTINRCCEAVEPNRSLLFHRNVRIVDIFISRIVIELLSVTLAVGSIFIVFVLTGFIPEPNDLLKMFEGWGLICWYAAAMAFVVGGLSEYSEVVEKLWHPISYFQLPVSGAFALASSIPERYRGILLAFPVPNFVELFRDGYYGDSIKTYYNTAYASSVCAVLTFIGLFIVRDISSRSE